MVFHSFNLLSFEISLSCITQEAASTFCFDWLKSTVFENFRFAVYSVCDGQWLYSWFATKSFFSHSNNLLSILAFHPFLISDSILFCKSLSEYTRLARCLEMLTALWSSSMCLASLCLLARIDEQHGHCINLFMFLLLNFWSFFISWFLFLDSAHHIVNYGYGCS